MPAATTTAAAAEPVKGLLTVGVVEARGLHNLDMFGQSDPYVVVTVSKAAERTAVVENNNSPQFNEEFKFDTELAATSTVVVTVMDKDAAADELIGAVTVPVEDAFWGKDSRAWYTLTSSKGKPAGEIHLDLHWNQEGFDLEDIDDFVDKATFALSGARPWYLRASYYYGASKGAYAYATTLPVARAIAPTLESTVETVLQKAGVAVAPEDGSSATGRADTNIASAMDNVDLYIDQAKDNLLQSLKNAKKGLVKLQEDNQSTGGAITRKITQTTVQVTEFVTPILAGLPVVGPYFVAEDA